MNETSSLQPTKEIRPLHTCQHLSENCNCVFFLFSSLKFRIINVNKKPSSYLAYHTKKRQNEKPTGSFKDGFMVPHLSTIKKIMVVAVVWCGVWMSTISSNSSLLLNPTLNLESILECRVTNTTESGPDDFVMQIAHCIPHWGARSLTDSLLGQTLVRTLHLDRTSTVACKNVSPNPSNPSACM